MCCYGDMKSFPRGPVTLFYVSLDVYIYFLNFTCLPHYLFWPPSLFICFQKPSVCLPYSHHTPHHLICLITSCHNPIRTSHTSSYLPYYLHTSLVCPGIASRTPFFLPILNQGSTFTTATTANAVTSSAFAVMPFKFGF